MHLSISSTLKLFGVAACLGLLVIVALSVIVLGRVEISGPIYNQIAVGQGIEGDIEPPPLYVVEAYLDANLAAAHPHDLATYRAALTDLHQQYVDRHGFWQNSNLPVELKKELQETSDAGVQQFWKELEHDLLPAIAAGNAPQVSQSMASLDVIFRAHRALVIDIINKVTALDDANQAMAQHEIRFFSRLLYANAAVVLLLIAGGVFWISRKAVTPIDGMTQYMRQLATGEFAREPPYQSRPDEIGDMAKSVAVFRDAMMAQLRAEKELAAERAAAEIERDKSEAATGVSMGQLGFVVETMDDALRRLAGGDLVFRLRAPFSESYEKLRHDFNGALEQLQRTMTSIGSTTQAVSSTAGEVAQASDDLARRTEQQAASLEQTAAALDRITATVGKTAEGADEARKVVAESKADAESSGAIVGDTVSAMRGIEKSSKEIGNVIGLIDEIAFQTNLLALNAGIEAARAGDAGRGFAVVATEVRALAQRSTTAAKVIKDLVSASDQQVESGVKLVDETGQALGRIVRQVDRLNLLVSEIAASAREQAGALAEVNTAVNRMDQMTQQNSAMVEETTAGSHNLAREADELAQLVGLFQLGSAASRSLPELTN
ncbi:methyl-accepting chemotaxis protein [Acidisoma sp.]|uniref:methyl-accepting chemotaxis protein n=1 Tax=Acidisoma sp. TaxID=1872115 RepID=UPI003AFFB40C